jgi:hypothetical protein
MLLTWTTICLRSSSGHVAGPALVNLGWALATGANIRPLATWLAAVIIGGFFVPS